MNGLSDFERKIFKFFYCIGQIVIKRILMIDKIKSTDKMSLNFHKQIFIIFIIFSSRLFSASSQDQHGIIDGY